MNKLSGTLVYVAAQQPVPAYVKPGNPPKPPEWKASIVLTDKKVKKDFEKYAASIDANVSLKEVDSEDFESAYKCPLPEGAGEEVWVVTLRKSTELGKTGKPVPEGLRPRVFEQTEEDGKILRTDVTNTKLVGNGSKGSISIDLFERTNGTKSLYLKNILVTDLVEYEAPDRAPAGSEFDDEDNTPVTVKAATPSPTAQTKARRASAPPVPSAPQDDDDVAPF
jgi:hypothetical protein